MVIQKQEHILFRTDIPLLKIIVMEKTHYFEKNTIIFVQNCCIRYFF